MPRGRHQRVFLEMAYKPAVTALMHLAADAGWHTVSGLEALVSQGIYQVRKLVCICNDPLSPPSLLFLLLLLLLLLITSLKRVYLKKKGKRQFQGVREKRRV